jgi:hypothetical protein
VSKQTSPGGRTGTEFWVFGNCVKRAELKVQQTALPHCKEGVAGLSHRHPTNKHTVREVLCCSALYLTPHLLVVVVVEQHANPFIAPVLSATGENNCHLDSEGYSC